MNFDQVSPRSMEYLAKVAETPDQFEELTLQFIAQREADNLVVPDFDEKYEWLNTSEKLSFKTNLLKKICVLDFFTYCCVNCMHILPQLHELEEKYSVEDGLVVLGVHSAKFPNEKVLSNILSAVLRYDINHPVVNDADAELWNLMSIRCWPTFVVVSPEGKPLLYLVGEGHKDVLFKFVELALRYYGKKGLISKNTVPIQLAKDNLNTSILKFPGKISLNQDGTLIAVSNTGEHRVLVFNEEGIISTIIGTGVSGLKDGTFHNCELNSPQGLAWLGRSLYIADTENHVIRKADQDSGTLITVVGTGKQGEDKEGGKKSVEQEISSPWDVAIAAAPGVDQDTCKENCLYIAAAGTHQLWCYFIEDGSWLKKGSQKQGTCLRFAGSGNEENRNNSYPHKASFAQLSHITLGKVKDQNTLFVADSESSSVRIVDLKTGAVKSCVGGERDPMNLFAYGDVDGKSFDAKLQHPLAVEYNVHDGTVYVADSYNHKIKKIDLSNVTCTTLTTKGGVGYLDGSFAQCQFNEPGGLALAHNGTRLYVADTNNHQIRVMNLKDNNVSTLTLIKGDQVDSPTPMLSTYGQLVTPTKSNTIQLKQTSRDLSSTIELAIDVILSEGFHFTENTESKWQASCSAVDGEDVLSFTNGVIGESKRNICTKLPFNHSEDVEIKVEFLLFVCVGELCMMKQYVILQNIHIDSNANADVIKITQKIEQ